MTTAQKVRVYFNLHKRCWSLVAIGGPNAGRVIAHEDKVILEDVSFVVRPAGRARVLRERKKNVHAFAVGTLASNAQIGCKERVTYNPFKAATFYLADRGPDARVNRADAAQLDQYGHVYCRFSHFVP
jgi:hypothetical protein